jgi:PAS domain S-box-containing protein
MKKKIPAKTEGEETRKHLREAAEHTLTEHPAVAPDLSTRTPEQVVHELQVHQIELEMQNEALRELQRVLEESRDRYSDLYDFAPVGYLTLTKHAVIEEANLTAAILLGVERKTLINDRIRKYVAGNNLERWDRYFTNILRKNEKQVCEMNLRKEDGSEISVRLESIRLERGGMEPVVRMAISDITDRVVAERKLARKSHDLDELGVAYSTIASGQEELKRTVSELSSREEELRDALDEKEVLLSEIHHRVKNNLTAFISLLSLEGPYDESAAGLALKKDLQNRARSMALIHETLYRTRKYSQVDMDIYVTTLVNQIAASFPGSDRIRMIVEAKEVTIDIARATPCGLIINEIITNSFKYAFPKSFSCPDSRHEPCTIRVAIKKDGELYELRVTDNGIGLPQEMDPKTTTTLGLKLVNFLARHQLRATVATLRDHGTEYVIRFGPAKPKAG